MKTFYQEMDSHERADLEDKMRRLRDTVLGFGALWGRVDPLLANPNISDPIAYGLLDALADSLSDIEKAREDVATMKRWRGPDGVPL